MGKIYLFQKPIQVTMVLIVKFTGSEQLIKKTGSL